MTEVISVRTEHVEELRKMAEKRDISISAVSSEIIDDFIRNTQLISKYEMFNDGRKYIASAFDNVYPSSFSKIAEIGARECEKGAKMTMNEPTLENLLSYFKGWIEINQLVLSEFEENEYIRWICQTKMGKNYNEITAKCFKMVLEKFGFNTYVESFDDDWFEIRFLKKKSQV